MGALAFALIAARRSGAYLAAIASP